MGVNLIENFTDKICSHIKLKEVHGQIKEEFISHIQEEADALVSQGLTADEAIASAISNMGDPDTLGMELNKAHHGQPEWRILVISLLFSTLGIMLLYFIKISNAVNYLSGSALNRSIAAFITGIFIIALLYKLNYQIVEKYSYHIFAAAIFLNFFCLITNYSYNNTIKSGLVSITPLLLAVALSGIFKQWKDTGKGSILQMLFLLMFPIFMFAKASTLSSVIIYLFLFITLVFFSKIGVKYIIASIISMSAAVFWNLSDNYYRIARLLAFLNPENDPNNSGYIYIKLKEVIYSSGALGNGFMFSPKALPEVHTDFIFAYVIHSFGWIGAVSLIAAITAFIVYLCKAALEIRDLYGKLLIIGITAIFTIEFVWNILMVLGAAPIAGIGLPFISFGVSSLLANMISIGIISSVYKRKSVESFCKTPIKI